MCGVIRQERTGGELIKFSATGMASARKPTPAPISLPVVALPMSRNQIKRLGERLAADDPPSDEDLCQLEELVARHAEALALARPRLDGLAVQVDTPPLHITHRAKTTQTIIEKLRRQKNMDLARMRDLAGIRVVGAVALAEQDAVCAEIARRFPADPRAPVIIDRRATPSHGYRAMHIEVSLDGITIEVQMRTVPQHLWADLMERLADRLGRQIRYGEPASPEGISQETAEAVLRGMMVLSDRWAHTWITPAGGQTFPLEKFMAEMRAAVSDALPPGIDL
jgi:ppGpp synthetase/RelA/SpoT-type nucleotidyltranferase